MHGLRERVHALDGLRTLAVSLVFMHHIFGGPAAKALANSHHEVAARFLSSFGAAGVELFFCLSGVVLLRRYLRDGQQLDARKYFQRRITRLYPPFVVAWLFAGLSVWIIDRRPTWWSVTSSLPHFETGSFFMEAGLGVGSPTTYNWAWWSLAPEMMFYALVPLLVYCLQRTRDLPASATNSLVACAIISLASYALMPDAGHGQLLPMFAQYAICFAGGMLLATRPLGKAERRGGAAVAVLLFIGAGFSDRVSLHVAYALIFLALIDLCMRSDTTISKVFGSDLLVWFGERSYSFFLTHFSIICLSCYAASLFIQKGTLYVLASRAMAIVVAPIVACMLFSMVERRFASGLTTADRPFPWSSSTVATTGDSALGITGNPAARE